MTRYARWVFPLLSWYCVVSPAIGQSLFEIDYGGARSHPFDLLHTAIDVRFDEAKKEVIGSVAHTVRSLSTGLDSLRIDADSAMTFSRISVNGVIARYRHQGRHLMIGLPNRRSYNDTFIVSIDYRVVPPAGLYFIQPDAQIPNGRRQIWTQGEAEDNHHWVPLYDYPNDRATTEVRATVREDWSVLSNGVLESVRSNSDGTKTWRWVQDQPHSSYLIMLAAGDYLVTRDTVDGVPLEYWSYPDMPERVATTFGRTPEIIRYFTKLTGVSYPWKKYAQVMIAEFMYGGMENTTATTLNDVALVDGRGMVDYNPDGLIAHEAAHQWFGDMVTNRSWAHLWIHESFATYMAALFRREYYGEDVFAKEMYDAAGTARRSDEWNGRDPIAGGKGITENLYQRGARVLYMLNQLLGDDLFWRANRLFLQRHAYGLVETNDLKIAYEDVTGLNLDWFFDQWVYKAGMPKVHVSYAHEGDSLRVYTRQIQERDSLTGLFRMRAPLEFHLRDRIVRDTMWIAGERDTLTIALAERPRFVIFDAGDVMLKTVDFPRSRQELIAQLDAPRMIDRFSAVRELLRKDSTSPGGEKAPVALALLARFKIEPSSFVRDEIMEKIVAFDSAVGIDVALLGLRDHDASVRKAAVEQSYIIPRAERGIVLRPLLEDSSYNVIGAALGMMAATDPTGLEPYFKELKWLKGRRDRIADAWLNAVSVAGMSSMVDDVADYTLSTFTKDTRAKAFLVLADLDTTTSRVRAAIERGLQDKSGYVRSSAATAARKRLDPLLRANLARLRDEVSGEPKTIIEDILSDAE